jgi:hypothetical protein
MYVVRLCWFIHNRHVSSDVAKYLWLYQFGNCVPFTPAAEALYIASFRCKRASFYANTEQITEQIIVQHSMNYS